VGINSQLKKRLALIHKAAEKERIGMAKTYRKTLQELLLRERNYKGRKWVERKTWILKKTVGKGGAGK